MHTHAHTQERVCTRRPCCTSSCNAAPEEGETAVVAQGNTAHGTPEAAPAGGLSQDTDTWWQGMRFEVSSIHLQLLGV